MFILLSIWYPPADYYIQQNIISDWVFYNLENYVCLDIISEILIADWDYWLCKYENYINTIFIPCTLSIASPKSLKNPK